MLLIKYMLKIGFHLRKILLISKSIGADQLALNDQRCELMPILCFLFLLHIQQVHVALFPTLKNIEHYFNVLVRKVQRLMKFISSIMKSIVLPRCKPRMALYGFDDTHLCLSSLPLLAFPELQYNGI